MSNIKLKMRVKIAEEVRLATIKALGVLVCLAAVRAALTSGGGTAATAPALGVPILSLEANQPWPF